MVTVTARRLVMNIFFSDVDGKLDYDLAVYSPIEVLNDVSTTKDHYFGAQVSGNFDFEQRDHHSLNTSS